MTISTRKGWDNAIESVLHLISAQLPAKIVTYNAAHSVHLLTRLSGDYTLGADKTLIITVSNGSAVTVTVPSGTYTVAQLVTQLNGDSDFSGAGLTAVARMNNNYVEIYKTTRGAAGSIKLGDGTINDTLGWYNGESVSWYPLRDIAFYKAQTEAEDDMIPAYPALVADVVSVDNGIDEGGGIYFVDYELSFRLYEVSAQGLEEQSLLYQLSRLTELVMDVLRDTTNRNLNGQVNASFVTTINPMREMQIADSMFRMGVEFSITVRVQED